MMEGDRLKRERHQGLENIAQTHTPRYTKHTNKLTLDVRVGPISLSHLSVLAESIKIRLFELHFFPFVSPLQLSQKRFSILAQFACCMSNRAN